MGNRASIVLVEKTDKGMINSPAIYIHWNGGPESVYAFLQELDNRQCRKSDLAYETARLIHIIGDFFDIENITTLSLGISNFDGEDYRTLDPGNNGVYIYNRKDDNMKRLVYGKMMKQAEVEAERRAAMESEQYKGILEMLAQDRKDKKIQ